MKQKSHFHGAVVLAVLFVAMPSGCDTQLPSFDVGTHEGFSSFDDRPVVCGGVDTTRRGWRFSAGMLSLQTNESGVVFGMQKTPSGKSEISYVVIFSRTISEDGVRMRGNNDANIKFDGEVATVTQGITLDANSIEFKFEFQVDREAVTFQLAKITNDNKEIDPSKGAVFLVDLRTSPVTYEQVNAKLAAVPYPDDQEEIKDLARQITTQLKSENDRVREFLEK